MQRRDFIKFACSAPTLSMFAPKVLGAPVVPRQSTVNGPILHTLWAPAISLVVGRKILPTSFGSGTNGEGYRVFVVMRLGGSGRTGQSEPVWPSTGEGATCVTTDSAGNLFQGYKCLFVDSVAGNDVSGFGNQNSPWATLNKITSVGAITSGRSVFAKANSIFVSDTVNLSGVVAGTGLPVVYDVYGRGAKPLINNFGVVKIPINFSNGSNLSIAGFAIKSESPIACTASENPVDGIIIRNLDVAAGGIHFLAVSGHNIGGVLIANCTISDGKSSGISMYADSSGIISRVTIINCKISGCVRDGVAIDSGSPSAPGQCHDITIKNSIFNNNGNGGINFVIPRGIAGATTDQYLLAARPYNVIVTNNKCIGNGGAGMEIAGCSTSGTGSLVQKNIVGDNRASGGIHITGCTNLIVESNTTYNNASLIPGADGCGIYLDVAPFPLGTRNEGVIVRENTCYNHIWNGPPGTDWFSDKLPTFNGNGPSSGIRLLGSQYCEVYSNICYNNSNGIWFEDACYGNRVHSNICVGSYQINLGLRDCFDTSNVIESNIAYGGKYNLFQCSEQNYPADTTVTVGPSAGGVGMFFTINGLSSRIPVNGIFTFTTNSGWARAVITSIGNASAVTIKGIIAPGIYPTKNYNNIVHVSQVGVLNSNCVYGAKGDGNNYGGTGYNYGNAIPVGPNDMCVGRSG